MRHHRVGRAVYAVGGDAAAARIAGMSIARPTIGLFVPGDMVAAVVIGGIDLDPGERSLIGALTGVLLLGIMQNMLTLSQIAAFRVDAAFGATILLSPVVARLGGREARRR